MNSRERMLAALNRQPSDHIPCSPHIWQGPLQGPLYWRNQFDRAGRMLEMGMDPVIDIWLPDVAPDTCVGVRTWRDVSGSEPLLTKEYHTPAGVLRQTVRETDDWCDSLHAHWIPTTFGPELRTHFNMEIFDDHNVSRRTEPWVKSRADLEALRYLIRKPEGWQLDEWRMDAQRAKEFADKHGLLLMARRTIVGDAFQWFCDINDFLCWMIEDPGFVRDFLAIFEEWSIDLTALALDAGVDVVQHRGWYDIPNYWGVKYWQEFTVPFIKRQADMVHESGKLYSYLLPEGHGIYAPLLKDLKIDAHQGVDPRMLHKGDLRSLYEQLGKCTTFWGGVNSEVTLKSDDAAQIDRAVREAIEALGGNDGLILSAILAPTGKPNGVMHMIEAWKKYRDR